MEQHKLIGKPIKRIEDSRFLRGEGQYSDDLSIDNLAQAVVLRSPHAHALIESIDVDEARAMPGVLGVYTAADIDSDIVSPISSMNHTPPFDIRNDDDQLQPEASQPLLALDRVRYAGQPVVLIVAESVLQAQDAAERVLIEYKALQAVMTYEDAIKDTSACIWPEHKSNRTLNRSTGDRQAVDQAFATAAHTVRCVVDNNRIAPGFMEPRSALAEYDPSSERYTLHTGCQSTHAVRTGLANVFGVEPERIRVIAPDTGGGFGARNMLYPEFALALIAARRLSRPVKWTATRSESFLTDAQARDQVLTGELALDESGQFLAMRVRMDWRHGAYFTARNVAVIAKFFPPTVGSVYRIPCAHITITGAFTNTTPQTAYRAIGRLEANYLTERLVDTAAQQLSIDPVVLRQNNLVASDRMPYQAAGGAQVTSGEFTYNLQRAMSLIDIDGFAERKQHARKTGLLRGIGIGLYLENDGAVPNEYAKVVATPDGDILVYVGTQDFGMGHTTMFSQVAADTLDINMDSIKIIFGDTDKVKSGFGSAGSRTARIGGGAVVQNALTMIDKAKQLAAQHFESSLEDIHYEHGEFSIKGTDRRVQLHELAAVAQTRGDELGSEGDFVTAGDAHSNGCHICEVDVDEDTGFVTIVQHVLVADVGRAVNPMIVAGQLHGGITQGLGQAGYEQVVYDTQSGQTLTGSLMDYTLPRADDMPMFITELNEVTEPDNPLGVKGAGEGPTTGSPAAMVNAVIDALHETGVRQVDMPLTPLRIWNALQEAKRT